MFCVNICLSCNTNSCFIHFAAMLWPSQTVLPVFACKSLSLMCFYCSLGWHSYGYMCAWHKAHKLCVPHPSLAIWCSACWLWLLGDGQSCIPAGWEPAGFNLAKHSTCWFRWLAHPRVEITFGGSCAADWLKAADPPWPMWDVAVLPRWSDCFKADHCCFFLCVKLSSYKIDIMRINCWILRGFYTKQRSHKELRV